MSRDPRKIDIGAVRGKGMDIKLGVFGEKNIVKRVQKIAEQFPSIEVLPFIFSEPSDAMDQAERAIMCDALLFTDYCSYNEAVKQKNKKLIHYIDYDEYSMLSSILHTGNLSQKKRLSMDYPAELEIDDLTRGIQSTEYKLFSKGYNKRDISNVQVLTHFHKELYSQGKTDFILTSRRSVYNQLLQEGLPVHFIQIPSKCIVQALRKIEETLEMTTPNLIITGILALKENIPIHLHHQVHMEVRQYLSRFCQKYDAMLLTNQENHYFMIGTGKLIHVIKENYRGLPLIEDIEKLADGPISLGFGLGLTPLTSQKHAYLALEACQSEKCSLSYLFNECQEQIGPIGKQKNIDTNKLFDMLVHQARLNNELSYLFIQFIVERNNEPFSSNDIADFYHVTKRSAERTLKKLTSSDIITIFGKERPYSKGRPRTLFILNQGI